MAKKSTEKLRGTYRFISKSDIKSGMMLKFRYTKVDNTTNDYMVLVIDPLRPDTRTNKIRLHAYDISELSDAQLIQFVTDLNAKLTITLNDKQQPIVKLNTDEAYKYFTTSTQYNDRPYKQFIPENMTQIRQIWVGTPDDEDVKTGKVQLI